MIRIYLQDGHQRAGLLREVVTTSVSLIDHIELSDAELERVAQHPLSPIPYSAKTLHELLKINTVIHLVPPKSIEQALAILSDWVSEREHERDAFMRGRSTTQSIERLIGSAQDLLREAQQLASAMEPSPNQKKLLDACQELGAKGYSITHILGILDPHGRPEIDAFTGEPIVDPPQPV